MADLTIHYGDSLPPRVDIYMDSAFLHPDVSTVVIEQSSSAGTFDVRGGPIPASSGAFVTDYEPPLGVTITYRARQYDEDGVALGLSGAIAAEMGDFPDGYVILQDPLGPRFWVQLRAEFRFADSLNHRRDRQIYRRGDATVALMGERGLLEDVVLNVFTESSEDEAALNSALESGYVLVRSLPSMPVPQLLHVVVAEASQVPADYRHGGTFSTWLITGSEVTRSVLAVLDSPVTWARFKAAFATWADMKAAYTTWLEAKRNPPPEV